MRWRQRRRSAPVSFLLSAGLALVVVAWFRGLGLAVISITGYMRWRGAGTWGGPIAVPLTPSAGSWVGRGGKSVGA